MEQYCWARNTEQFQSDLQETEQLKVLKTICPCSSSGSRAHNVHRWHCIACKEIIQFGSDGYFHCSCGRAPSSGYQFKCDSDKHGTEFLTLLRDQLTLMQDNLKRLSTQAKPDNEINILILGGTGVGKSTWINAVANYLSYPTLKEAEKEKLLNLIPASFTLIDKNYEEKSIVIGGDENENYTTGQSATQEPRSYVLHIENTLVRLIDTPGIGDTRGIDQDKKNFESTLRYLSNLDYLHGICILLKPNTPKLTVMFRFCIQELLKHLHREAGRNIVFCFTSARASNFEPGQTLPNLQALLKQLSLTNEVKICKNTMYYMDNESFRYLCAISQQVEFEGNKRSDFEESWKVSYEEVNRMIKYVASIKPFAVKEIISINEARQIIIQMQKPIADINRNIQENIILLEENKQKFQSSKDKAVELKKDLYIPMISLRPKKLKRPRTVCTSPNCVEYRKIAGFTTSSALFNTHCHDPCYLYDTSEGTGMCPNPLLKKCEVMTGWLFKTCKHCGCSWDVHKNISYEYEEVEESIENDGILERLKTLKSDEEKYEELFKSLDKRISQYEHEDEVIKKVSAKFGHFVKTNALLQKNDALEEYFKLNIKNAESKCDNEKMVERLKKCYEKYKRDVQFLEEAMNSSKGSELLKATDINDLKEQLFDLPVFGNQLKETVEMAKSAHSEIFHFQECHFTPFGKFFSVKDVLQFNSSPDKSNC